MPVLKKTIKRKVLCAVLLLKLCCTPLAMMAKPITISWYGRECAKKRMANGQKFDPKKLTAAHRKLPFGTRVLLFCFKTGKSVVVTITDRGPYMKKRSMDVSEQAARELGIHGAGIARVDMEILPNNVPAASVTHKSRRRSLRVVIACRIRDAWETRMYECRIPLLTGISV